MGLSESSVADTFDQHLSFFTRYFHETSEACIEVVRLRSSLGQPRLGPVVGFCVSQATSIEHLYIQPDHHRQGIGGQLLARAKARSTGQLELYTFKANKRAQAFYRQQGFVEVGRGHASPADNPWATEPAQLEDIKFQWRKRN